MEERLTEPVVDPLLLAALRAREEDEDVDDLEDEDLDDDEDLEDEDDEDWEDEDEEDEE
jgi:hypothetical protein